MTTSFLLTVLSETFFFKYLLDEWRRGVCQRGKAVQPFWWWDWWADMLKYRRTTDGETHTSLVFTCPICAHINTVFVCGCVHMHAYETAGVHIHTFSCVCSSKHICLLLLSKTHSHLNAEDRTHLSALWAARQLSQNILEYAHILHPRAHTHTHTHTCLPGVPHMQCLGSAKWNFLKAKNTSPEQTSLA